MRAIVYVFMACWGAVGLALLAPPTIVKMKALNAGEWASWVQAVGSIIALGVAFQIGRKQSRDALKAIEHGYNVADQRRLAAYAYIAEAAKDHCDACYATFPVGGFNYLGYETAELDQPQLNIVQALQVIPVHDVGSLDAVTSLLGLKISMGHLSKALARVEVHVNGFGGTIPGNSIPYETGAIRLCCETAIAHAENLISALKTP